MSWEVQITGSVQVLDELARVFVGPDLTVRKRSNEFFLQCRSFDRLTTATEVRNEAMRVGETLSGVSRVLLQSESSLRVGAVYELTSGSVFIQPEPAVLRITGGLTSIVVTRPDGKLEEHRPADAAPIWLARALGDPASERALRLRDVGDLSWTDLYRLFEVIVEGAGGKDQIVAKGWVTHETMRRFKHSANSLAAAGDQARHGVEMSAPPVNPMTLSEARALLDTLLRLWFR